MNKIIKINVFGNDYDFYCTRLEDDTFCVVTSHDKEDFCYSSMYHYEESFGEVLSKLCFHLNKIEHRRHEHLFVSRTVEDLQEEIKELKSKCRCGKK